jgi:hypothetical protein
MWPILPFLLLGVHQDAKTDPKPAPVAELVRVTAIVVPKGVVARLESKSGHLVSKVFVSDEKVLRVLDINVNSVLLEGMAVGITRLALTDKEKVEEKLIVIVEQPAEGSQKAHGK